MKEFAKIGMIVSLVVAFLGLLVLCGAFGGYNASSGVSTGGYYSYDYGFAEFGADFYTYVSNNAAMAYKHAANAASNLEIISHVLTSVLGIFIMGIGAISFCYFGMKFFDDESKKTAPQIIVNAPEANGVLVDDLPEL